MRDDLCQTVQYFPTVNATLDGKQTVEKMAEHSRNHWLSCHCICGKRLLILRNCTRAIHYFGRETQITTVKHVV